MVLTVVCVAIALYLLYLLRTPIGWLLIALFLALALAGPVNFLARHMRRGLAITIVYLGLLAIPMRADRPDRAAADHRGQQLRATTCPQYAHDVTEFVQDNERLRELNKDYDITSQLEKEAGKLPERLGGAAGTLRDVGFGIVNSAFALITILVLTAFMLGNGRRWTDAAIRTRPPEQRERLRRSLDHMAEAVAGYVAGALTIAVIAGVVTYIVLTILGVPFRAPLAVIAGLFSLIPLVGATIAAFLIGIVTLFENFPVATIIWVDLGDRLPAVREPPDPAADPEAHGQGAALHHDRGRAVRRDAARRAGRAGGDPGGRVDPDPAARVRRPAHAARSGPSRPSPAARAAAGPHRPRADPRRPASGSGEPLALPP